MSNLINQIATIARGRSQTAQVRAIIEASATVLRRQGIPVSIQFGKRSSRKPTTPKGTAPTVGKRLRRRSDGEYELVNDDAGVVRDSAGVVRDIDIETGSFANDGEGYEDETDYVQPGHVDPALLSDAARAGVR